MISAIEQIKRDEGFRGKPYKDSAGKVTIGYGRNLDANPVTKEEAEYLLKNDMQEVLHRAVKLPYYAKLNPSRRAVIINMLFNLGYTRFRNFKRMNAALIVHDYNLAAIEMIDSFWATQVKGRATRLAKQMKEG